MRSAEDLEAAFAAGADDPPASAAGPLRVGQDLGTRYTVLKLLGAGGMGVVYQALDRDLGVPVALKVLRQPAGNPRALIEMQRRFKTELLLARKVTHKHVIRIHDIGDVDGIKFITMPFVEGQDLASCLKKGPLSVPRAVRFARQLASGLAAAHAAGVIHRDLKPANVMIGDDDNALLMDFGIARSNSPGGPQRTIAGAVVGTAAYMAPEQARGEKVDERADIYAFGLILHEMLCGPRFMAKGAVADLFARMTAPPASARSVNPQVPEALDAILTRCVQPGATERYQTAAELAAALAALSRRGHGPVPGAAAAPKRWLVKAAAVLALMALAGLAAWHIPRANVAAAPVGRTLPDVTQRSEGRSDPPSSVSGVGGEPGPTTAALNALEQRVRVLENAPGGLIQIARQAEETVKANPRNYRAYVPIAAAAALTSPAKAHGAYERMAAVKPEGESLAASGFADLAMYQQRPAEAVEILQPAITHDTHMKLPGVASKYLTLAEARADQGRPADALIAVDRALEVSRHENVLLPAARLFVELDHEARAVALARELTERATTRARAYAGIINAEIAMHRGNAAGAIETLRNVVQTTDLWLARFVLGTAFMQARRFDEAHAEFATCQLRRGEATTLFDDDVPTLRYLRMLEDYLRSSAARLQS